MPPRKYTNELIIECLIDRFYGVPLIDIEKEHGVSKNTMQSIIKKRYNKKRKAKINYYREAFEEALVQLDVTEEEYLKEMTRHISNERSASIKEKNKQLRKFSKDQIHLVLRHLFKEPTSTSQIAKETGLDDNLIYRIRFLHAHQEMTEEYIRSHNIKNPEKFLYSPPYGSNGHGYPPLTDELVKRFFYSYIAGAPRTRAAANASISRHSANLLLRLEHPTKRKLMIELIISEGFTPQTFLSYVKKKSIKQGIRTKKLRNHFDDKKK